VKLEDIIKKESDVTAIGWDIVNNIITHIDVNTIAHFGNTTCFEIACKDVYPMSCYNNTQNLGYILKAFIEFFELDEEDGLRLSDIKNIPCRLIFDSTNGCPWGHKCIGIGHFMKNKFVFIQDLVKVNE
jgi:hypothetical protein